MFGVDFVPPAVAREDVECVADGYKLFWLAARPGGDVVIDSVRGDERPSEG